MIFNGQKIDLFAGSHREWPARSVTGSLVGHQ